MLLPLSMIVTPCVHASKAHNAPKLHNMTWNINKNEIGKDKNDSTSNLQI